MLGRRQKDRFFRFLSQMSNDIPSFSGSDRSLWGQRSWTDRGWNAASHAANAASDAASHAASHASRVPYALMGRDSWMDRMGRGLSWLMPGRRSGWMESEPPMSGALAGWMSAMDRLPDMRNMRWRTSSRRHRSHHRSNGTGVIGSIAILGAAAGVAIVGTALLALYEQKAQDEANGVRGQSPGGPTAKSTSRSGGAVASGTELP
jgi:hypothetical protein